MRFGDSSTFLYQSGFGTLSGPLPGAILEVFLEPPEQLWAPGGVLGATWPDFLSFCFACNFLYEKMRRKGSLKEESDGMGPGACGAEGKHTFPHKSRGFTWGKPHFAKTQLFAAPKQMT